MKESENRDLSKSESSKEACQLIDIVLKAHYF